MDPRQPDAQSNPSGGPVPAPADHTPLIEAARRQAAQASAWRERIQGALTRTQLGATGSRAPLRDGFVDPGRFPAGTVLAERYRIIEMLGRGGMGEVYRVDDLKLGQTIALKFLTRAADVSLGSDDMHREVRIARQVSHPNVCRVYDIGEIEGHPFISMEYIDGENLGVLLKRIGRLPPAKALDVARQLCAALAAAHDAGILHRDLKPTNVMIDGRGKVRITDFGLAGIAEQFHAGEVRAGTPAYMAPEQLAGTEVSVRSDLFALGLVLYELFTGQHPFPFRTDADRNSRSTPTRPARVVQDIDPQVERVILRCLERDPLRRPPSALAVAAALPGTDPLAAALAAGETPSPEMVAAAGAVTGVTGRTALGAYVLVLAGVLGVAWLNPRAYVWALVALPKPPEVLADHSRGIIETLGYHTRPADTAYGFREDAAALGSLARDDGREGGSAAATRPGAIYFWYRESPVPLVARDAGGVVAADDPAALESGMINLRIDPRGRLLEFRAVPYPDPDRAASDPLDAAVLLRLAGLPADPFQPVDASITPSVYCDRTGAWEGRCEEFGDRPVRLEAGACAGRINYVRISTGTAGASRSEARDWTATALQASNLIIAAIGLFGGAFLGWRNVQLGRGDRRGAARIGGYVFASYILIWLLLADHVATPDGEWDLFLRGVARALFFAVWAWVLYLALEPYVRRIWPNSIITWSRLLAGRWSDPAIGRDILIGGLLGVASQGVALADQFVPWWLGLSPSRPLPAFLDTLLGLRQAAGLLLWGQVNACFQPMFALVIILVFRVVLRSLLAGYAAVWILFVAWLVLSRHALSDPALLVDLALFGPLVATWIYVLNRYGLLAAIAAYLFVSLVSYYPLSLDLTAWSAETSLLILASTFALATFGFASAVRGRSVFEDEIAVA